MDVTCHIYEQATGLFNGISLSTSSTRGAEGAEFIIGNTPSGCAAYIGSGVDTQAQRIDTISGELVAYQSPHSKSDRVE